MAQNTLTSVNIIQSLDKLKILLFWEILKENNPLFLDENYFSTKAYTAEQRKHIVEAWELLYDSYYQYRNDSKGKVVLSNNSELMILGATIKTIEKNISACTHFIDVKYLFPEDMAVQHEFLLIELFNKIDPRIKADNSGSLEEACGRATNILKALKNKFDRITKTNNKEIDKQIANTYDVIANVSKIVGFRIDVKDMMVTEWLAYEKQARETIKAQERANSKHTKKK